ncbi:hypothetical protein ACLB1G_10775 [Oxalobacteraceae bacterium A2-2]
MPDYKWSNAHVVRMMAGANRAIERVPGVPAVVQPEVIAALSKVEAAYQEEARRRRRQAAMLTFGAWKGRTDIPLDGVEYQELMRSE